MVTAHLEPWRRPVSGLDADNTTARNDNEAARGCTNPHIAPINTRRGINVGTMLAQRRRRWPNIEPTLDPRLGLLV